MSAQGSDRPQAGADPRSPTLRRMLFSVGAWITAATLTAVGTLGTTGTGDHPAVTWLLSQLAPGLLVLLTIGLLVTFVSGAVRLRRYRRRQTVPELDPVEPPPPVVSGWPLDTASDSTIQQKLTESGLPEDLERVRRIDVRGSGNVSWSDVADRILQALDLPGIEWPTGATEPTVRAETARRCALALDAGEVLVLLDRERRAPDRTTWLFEAFAGGGHTRKSATSAPRDRFLLVIEQPEPDATGIDQESLPNTSDEFLLLQTFAWLSVDELDTDGMIALNNEIAIFLETAVADRGYSPTAALAAVRRRCQVTDVPAGGFRLSASMRDALRKRWSAEHRTVPPARRQAVRAATSWLLRHYARLCTAWCRELGVPERARVAARWFRTKEPLLRSLVIDPMPRPDSLDRAVGRRDQQAETRIRLRLVIDDLARIADALDVWYRREHQAWLAVQVSDALWSKAEFVGLTTLTTLARFRRAAAGRALHAAPSGNVHTVAGASAGGTRRAGERQDGTDAIGGDQQPTGWPPADIEVRQHPRRFRSALRSRLAHDRAMFALTAGERTDNGLRDVEQLLREAWLWLPRNDLVGAATILINLSIVHLHQGRLQPARDRLDLAESLAVTANDAGARARATELQGVAAWSGGQGSRAMQQWELGRQRYRALGERYGEGRCCQHLGSAALHAPAMATVGLRVATGRDGTTDEAGVTGIDAARYAYRMLLRAQRLLGAEAALSERRLRRFPEGLLDDLAGGDQPDLEPSFPGNPDAAGPASGDEPTAFERIPPQLRKLVDRWTTKPRNS